jgi:predicted membrane protein
MEHMFWVSIMGGHRTPSGPWRPDRNNVAVSIMGGQQLDFTQAVLDEGETRLYVVVLLGGARITVPRGIDVVVEGLNIMGGRRVETAMPLEPTRGPHLRITALVALGGLRVRTAG